MEAEEGFREYSARVRKKLFVGRHERKLGASDERKARETLRKAFAIDIACGIKLARLAKYASEHPEKAFVGVDARRLNREGKRALKRFPNLFFVRAGALTALKLVEPNSKRVINFDFFPYFDAGNNIPENMRFRQKLFAEVLRALKPGGILSISTEHVPEAREELESVGFAVGTPRKWGEGMLKLDYASPFVRSHTEMPGLGYIPRLLIAKKPLTPREPKPWPVRKKREPAVRLTE